MKTVVCSLVFPVFKNFVRLAIGKTGISKGFYNGYGGKVEEGETILECAIRETLDESGGLVLHPDYLKKVCVVTFHWNAEIDGLSRPGACDVEVHVYRAERTTGEPKETEAFLAPMRFAFEALPFHKMLPGEHVWLSQALKTNKPFTAEVWYDTTETGLVFNGHFVIHELPDLALIAKP